MPRRLPPMHAQPPHRYASFGQAPRFLYLVAFVAGMTTLAVEVSTSRLVANVFGSSNVVWAGVIGMTLFYLMVGYFLGGRWADRSPSAVTFYRLVAWTAFGVGVMPAVSRPVLRAAVVGLQQSDLAVAMASAIGTAILFIVPMTLLGCIPPFTIRLAVRRVSKSGQVTGRIFALSTAGGLLGVFGPVLVLIPRIGSPATFALYASVLLLVAMVGLGFAGPGLVLSHLWMLPTLAVVVTLGLQGPFKPPPSGTRLLYERETSYNYVQVVELSDQTRLLLLNEGLAVHSVYHPTQLATNGTWDYFLIAPYFNPPPYAPERVTRVAVLGLAAGTIARQYTAVYGPIPIDGVEIDPGIVETGRRYFDMNMPNLNVIVEDARFALSHLRDDYQVIGIDAYRPPYIPWQLTTREFFTEVRAHLADDGVVVINVGRTATDRRLVEALTATMLQVFPTVHTLDVPGTFNTMLVATAQATRSEDLVANANLLGEQAHPLLRHSFDLALRSLQPTVASDLVFTDDRAPVELLADSIVLRFVLEGGLSQLPPVGQ